MPMKLSDYPANWKWLSRQIIATAGNRCELCYAPNGVLVVRDTAARHPWSMPELSCGELEERLVKIVLTVHHIDSDKHNCVKQNLIALCQRCHLRLDLLKHMRNRSSKRELGCLAMDIKELC